jgi:WD40 repeat protein
VAFGPGGRILATGSGDSTAILWDLGDRGDPVRLTTLTGHSDAVWAVAFGAADSHTVVTGSGDGTAILWDLSDRAHLTRLATLTGHTDAVYAVAYGPDGHTVATGSGDGTAILWDVTEVTLTAAHAVVQACAMAGPALSRADWARYVPGVPYERVCP